ncbi:gliding motility-associated C-terminal domain-containing protein [Bacteroidales bacterium OttesenSCG-928-B11]|nr:gliding motility-associated C-terminal domain-containing protein [Bacteroidales bacterium OttesenSCG-928-E04]MDL2308726.1 gliding motility-associated C-terminal domain-containing protein [Bacteroidales bacterium OttesenSCG-928-C03]MDL2312326.1 gliding motility-associated C-terminal domain-containing protein [Bacteroidales bacterium OttesenSCG-928-B11]MDL2326841.1 gliding motility-associated C-terminal domain-containing protein [Bacteroidales bacterium OttesenSCG-928-A14]
MKKAFIFAVLLAIPLLSFSQVFSAGKDTVICSGQPVHITPVLDESLYYYYRWRPATNLSDSTIPAPWVWPDVTTTYYFYGYRPDHNNLVVNGDFQQGNTGFTSHYSYRTPSGNRTLWSEATYTIASTGLSVHENFTSQYDHTLGTAAGQFMVVNASGTANAVVWEQTINNIIPNTDYVFYTWATSVNASSPAILQFRINGALLDQPFALNGQPTWAQFYTLWNSGNSTSATITIVNQNIAPSGNDFGVDDIFFAPIYPDIDSITITIAEPDSTHTTVRMCADASYVFNGKNIIVETGTYVDTLKTMLGCDSITILDIAFYPELTVEMIEDQIICREDTASITIGPEYDYFSYKWSTGDTTQKIVVAESGTYTITVTNEIGCEAVTSVDILFVEKPETNIVNEPAIFCEDYKMQLTVETEASEILWSTGAITPEIEILEFGNYYVTVSEYHCSTVDTFEVAFCCPDNSNLPNVITPSNGDGTNDNFEFSRILPFETIELYIYDRWGKRVFHTTTPEFKWGGTVGGNVKTGLYYYYLKYEDGCTFHGSITVL